MFNLIVTVALSAATDRPPTSPPAATPTPQTAPVPSPPAVPAPVPAQPGGDAGPVTRGDKGDATFAAQVLLDRAGFSSGVIDGHFGDLAVSATKAFQESAGLEPTGIVDEQTWAALRTNGNPPAFVTVSVDMNVEVADGRLPSKPQQQAKLKALSYETLVEAVAEKYHTTPAALAKLNPGVEVSAGATLRVPNVQIDSTQEAVASVSVSGKTARATTSAQKWSTTLESLSVATQQVTVAKLVVVKSGKYLRALDPSGQILAQFPATIGSTKNPSPTGDLTLRTIAYNPTYNYDPEVLDKPGSKKFKLPPGPNNVVGVVWLDLSKENYGIHGTAEPSQIGRAASHGCIRLTNWDAAKLAQMVKPGITVSFEL